MTIFSAITKTFRMIPRSRIVEHYAPPRNKKRVSRPCKTFFALALPILKCDFFLKLYFRGSLSSEVKLPKIVLTNKSIHEHHTCLYLSQGSKGI